MLNLNLNINNTPIFGAAPAPGPVCPAQTISMASIMGYYKFDDDYTKSLGEAFFATPSPNNMNPFATGKFGSAASFNGVNSWLAYGNNNTMEPDGIGGWTLSTWVSLDDYSNNQSIWDKRVPGTSGMRVLIRPGAIRDILVTWNSQNQGFSLPAGVFTDNTWHHVVVRQNAGANTFTLFVDDVSLGTATRTTYSLSSQNLNVGRDRANTSSYLNGRLDEYSVWDRALTDGEITALAAGTCPLTSATGFLDDYTGAEAAYSLRALNSEYTGYAVRVRRSSDNSEQNFGFINGELDTTAIASFCSGTDGFITTWYDQSGNGNNATQTTATQQPRLYSNVLSDFFRDNGKVSTYFDSADSMDANSAAAAFSGTDKYLSSFLVFSSVSANANRAWFSLGRSTTSTPLRWFGQGTSGNEFRLDERDDGSTLTTTTGGDCGTQTLGTVISNMDSKEVWDITTSIGTDTASMGAATFDRFALGCLSRNTKSVFAAGYFQELIVYPSNKSTDRTDIQSNIINYYSIS